MVANATTLKTNISKLKTRVLEIDREDTSVCAALDELYSLVERLNQLQVNGMQENEIILVQKFANRFITKINRNKLHTDSLGDFSLLKNILMATYIIKVAYHNIVDPTYRTEAELAAISENINDLRDKKIEYEHLLEKAEQISKLENSIDNAKIVIQKVEKLDEEVNDYKENISNNTKLSDETLKKIEENHKISSKSVVEIDVNKKQISEQLDQINQYQKTYEETFADLQKLTSDTKAQFDHQHEEINKILGDADRVSMASSFNTRKKEITTTIRWLDVITYSVLLIISSILLYIFASSYKEGVFSLIQFFSRLPITLPLIWIAWLTSRKSAYFTKIKEDYAYKYSSAMAFEGYKKQVQEISPELEVKLLDIAVNNLGDNPIRLFDSKIKHTPIDYEEILQHITKLPSERIEQISDFLKKLASKK